MGGNGTYRVWAKRFDRYGLVRERGRAVGAWHMRRIGFRAGTLYTGQNG